jgi:hypothetical protein
MALAGCVSSPDLFTAHRRQAVRDFSAPEAQAYMQVLLPAIGADLANLMKKCTTEFSGEEAA